MKVIALVLSALGSNSSCRAYCFRWMWHSYKPTVIKGSDSSCYVTHRSDSLIYCQPLKLTGQNVTFKYSQQSKRIALQVFSYIYWYTKLFLKSTWIQRKTCCDSMAKFNIEVMVKQECLNNEYKSETEISNWLFIRESVHCL